MSASFATYHATRSECALGFRQDILVVLEWSATGDEAEKRRDETERLIKAAPALLVALRALAALNRTPDEHASPEILAARAALKLVEAE